MNGLTPKETRMLAMIRELAANNNMPTAQHYVNQWLRTARTPTARARRIGALHTVRGFCLTGFNKEKTK